MVGKRELVEAQAFSRRRLVTAFVSGAPDGHEVEPARRGRTLVAGVALAGLVLGGAAISGQLTDRPDSGWKRDESFVIAEETGEQYVVLDSRDSSGGRVPELHAVPNKVSAQLVLGRHDLERFNVAQRHLDEVRQGRPLGIVAAPSSLAPVSRLRQDEWTACTSDDRGVLLRLDPRRDLPEEPIGAFVGEEPDGGRWLVAAGADGLVHRYRLPKGDRGTYFGNWLKLSVLTLDQRWLRLLPEGTPLTAEAFGLTGQGGRVGYGQLNGRKVGDMVQIQGVNYLLDADRPRQLDDFEATLYKAVHGDPIMLSDALRIGAPPAETPADWPQALPDPLSMRGTAPALCALLRSGDRGRPSTSLVATAVEDGLPERGVVDVWVTPDTGAYVRPVSGTEDPAPAYVIDARGSAHRLEGDSVPGLLGYADIVPSAIPAAWLAFFEPGAALSVKAARNP